MKRNVITQYNLPGEVRFCKKCTISNQRPRNNSMPQKFAPPANTVLSTAAV